MKKRFASVVVGALSAFGLSVSNAFAALDLTGVEANTADVAAIMAIVVPALFVLWGFRKVVKTTNRS